MRFTGRDFNNISTGLSGRKTDGLFGYEKNPKHSRVSGILVSDVHHMTIHRSKVRYFHNPYGSNPFTFDGLLPETMLTEKGLEFIEGYPLSHYLDALAHWK